MKRYLVFSGFHSAKGGGLGDFSGSFAEVEDAICFAVESDNAWWQIFDCDERKVVTAWISGEVTPGEELLAIEHVLSNGE